MALEQAIALHRQGRLAEAEMLYRQVLARDASQFGPHYHLGILSMQRERFAEAVTFLEAALHRKDGDIATLVNLGMALCQLDRHAEALSPLARAIAAKPDLAEAHYQQAVALHGLKRMAEAAEAAARAATLAPGHDRAAFLHAVTLEALGRAQEACDLYDRLLTRTPNDADLWNRRGRVLWTLNREPEALESFDRSVALKPDFAKALANRGSLRWAVEHDYETARADLSRALALAPELPWLEGELFYLRMQNAEWDGIDAERAALEAGVAAGRQVVKPFAYQAISSDPASLQRCSRILAAADYPALAAARTGARAPKRESGRIRVGYVSAEFREQATAYLMAGVYEAHDRRDFEITAFDNGYDDGGTMRARLERAFDHFVPITALTDDAAAAAVRAAGIDILVNLNGYFGKPRMHVFARRAAPVQVNYLGFPATLGAPYMDYIIADRIVIPQAEQRFYDEAVAWLPDCYQANDAKRVRPAPSSRAEHGLPPDAFIFCNFNQSYKLSPDSFALWMRVLRSCPDSVLWLLHDRDAANANLRREAERQGVAAERLIFAPLMPQEPHLARIALADLFLDTLPYNAHTTGSDALWAGVPLVTCRGTAFAGRVAASLLTAANLPELVTENPADYEALAIRLWHERTLLAGMRARLAANRETCALFDTARFTRHLEAAYRTMAERSRAGRAPESFSVSAQ